MPPPAAGSDCCSPRGDLMIPTPLRHLNWVSRLAISRKLSIKILRSSARNHPLVIRKHTGQLTIIMMVGGIHLAISSFFKTFIFSPDASKKIWDIQKTPGTPTPTSSCDRLKEGHEALSRFVFAKPHAPNDAESEMDSGK